MLNSKREQHKVYNFSILENEYKEEIKTPVLYKEIPISIAYTGNSVSDNNDVRLKEVTYIGVCEEQLPEGATIDKRYTIVFSLPMGASEWLHYLKEIR